MSRKELGGQNFRFSLEDIPTEHFREVFKSNMPAAANKLRKNAVRSIKNRLNEGVSGAGYDPKYAKRKSRMKLKNYNASGPVDLEFSGQLKAALRGRARVDKGKGIIEFTLEFKPNSRKPFKRSPGAKPSGGNITNEQLAKILNRTKRSAEGPPISLRREEARSAVNKTARQLIDARKS